jgi:hypothetical protein
VSSDADNTGQLDAQTLLALDWGDTYARAGDLGTLA